MIFLYLPFAAQGIAMFFDELYFHRKRGLPRWERIGHPLDTVTVLAVYAFLNLNPYSIENQNIAIALGAFSCLFITKDEFVHTQHCEAAENWLHAVLFVLHPISLGIAIYFWAQNMASDFLKIQSLVVLLFLIFQILYWSAFAKRKQ